MSTKFYAIISGELAESRKLSQDQLGRIPDIIRECFAAIGRQPVVLGKLDYEIIRMDEFLCMNDAPSKALHASILLASEFRRRSYAELNIRADLRLSLAIGPVELLQQALRESDGTAIRNASRGLETMKRNQRLVIQCMDKNHNDELLVSCGFMDILIHDWSDEQAEALFHSLTGKNQTQISEELNISQPAVNRRLKAAHLEAIEKFINRFEAIIE